MTHAIARTLAGALVAAIITSCESAPTAPADDAIQAQLTAATMLRTADSLVLGGNSDAAVPFGDAGAVLAVLGRSATVRVTENGTASEYHAVAQRYLLPAGACSPPPIAAPLPGAAPRPYPLPVGCFLAARPVLLLWKGTSPDRVIMVSAPEGVSHLGGPAIGAAAFPMSAVGGRTSSLMVERPGFAFWFGTEGTVDVGTPSVGGPCAVPPKLPTGVAATCATATIGSSFDITYGIRYPINELALGVAPRLKLEATTVPAVVVTITDAGPVVTPIPPDSVRPPLPMPPPTPPPGDSGHATPLPPIPLPPWPPFPAPPLAGRLDARRDSGGIVFTLTVANLSRDSLRVQFSSGQSFDFAVRTPDRELWRWSVDKTFTLALRTMGWAPGELRTFTARWPGPVPAGVPLVAVGVLTSSNYRIESVAPVLASP